MMIPHSVIDSFHSILMDDDEFNEAVMRVAVDLSKDRLEALRLNDPQSGAYSWDDVIDLANELCCRISVS